MDQTTSKASRKNSKIKKDRALEARRRKAAQDALQKLKANVTLSSSDRATFARNLGSMFDRCNKNKDKLSLNKLFIDAFGEHAGPSDYKKRKSLIHLPSEDTVAEDLCAKSLKYRTLALTMAKYLVTSDSENEQDKQIAAIQRLIENSSFDSMETLRSRQDREYREEINLRLNQLCGKVAQAVDLDWMYSWTKKHPVRANGPTGKLDGVRQMQSWSDHFEEGSLAIDGPVENCLAPCVRIGTVLTRIYAENFIELDIDETEGPIDSAIRKKLSNILSLDNLSAEHTDTDIEIWTKILQSDLWSTNKEEPFWYRTKRFLDLELRYDESSDNWLPCLLLRFTLQDGLYCNTMMDFIDDALGSTFLVFEADADIACIAVNAHRNKYRLFFIDCTDVYSSRGSTLTPQENDCFRGVRDNEGITPRNPEFFNFLLSTSNNRHDGSYQCSRDHDYELLGYSPWILKSDISASELCQVQDSPGTECYYPDALDFESHQFFCKAPKGSIAYEILSNLAYVPISKRLDTLLIADAKHKYGILKAHAEKLERNYESSISKFT